MFSLFPAARRAWTLAALGLLAACASPVDPVALIEAGPPAAGSVLIAVGPVSPLPAGTAQVARLQDVPWASLPPGAEVRIGPGRYSGATMINARGSAAQPVVVRGAPGQAAPVLSGSIDFQQASQVRLSGVVIDGSPYAAVVIRNGSDHITVANSTLQRSAMGVSITSGAGTGHVIRDNLIADNLTVGIAVDRVNALAGDRSRILRNRVLRSGHHGMEIQGSNYLIEHNETAYSGQAIGGTSGIHLYSASPAEDSGDHNVVRYNFSHHNRDVSASDGNGIQADQWCDDNEIAFNVVWANDGAGITLFDAANNRVYGNTALGNALDPAGTHGDRAEILLNSAGSATDRTQGNRVWNNTAVSVRAGVPALMLDARSAARSNSVGPNHLHSRTAMAAMRRGAALLNTGAAIDAATATRGNLVEAPVFQNEAAPLQHGLRLARTPSARGAALRSGVLDMQGSTPVSGDSLFGAYFTPAGL